VGARNLRSLAVHCGTSERTRQRAARSLRMGPVSGWYLIEMSSAVATSGTALRSGIAHVHCRFGASQELLSSGYGVAIPSRAGSSGIFTANPGLTRPHRF